jgi:hypothetical protein
MEARKRRSVDYHEQMVTKTVEHVPCPNVSTEGNVEVEGCFVFTEIKKK